MIMKRTLLALSLVAVCGAAHADPMVYDTGFPHTVMFNGSETYLGFSSGSLAGLPQRWSAMPFTLTQATTITGVDINWFIVAGSEGVDVKYIIWKRTGINQAPVDGDQVAVGTLGPFGPGIDDPDVVGTEDWLHEYRNLNIPLPAGDYYLTQYSEGLGQGNVTGDSNTPWLTGGQAQDPNLEQDGFFRSTAFPNPGFAWYNPSSVQPGPNMTDPLDRWVQCFSLYGTSTTTEEVCPASYTIMFGSLVSGGIADVCNSDDSRMVFANGSTFLITQSPITVQYFGTTTISAPTEVKTTVEYSVSLVNLMARVDMRNYATSQWVQVDQRSASLTDEVVTASKTTDAADYVSGSGEVGIQVRVRDDAPAFLATWQGRYDQVKSTVTG